MLATGTEEDRPGDAEPATALSDDLPRAATANRRGERAAASGGGGGGDADAEGGESAARTPQVVRLTDARTRQRITLVGTMHYNPASVRRARSEVAAVSAAGAGEPAQALGAVVVESCQARWTRSLELAPPNSFVARYFPSGQSFPLPFPFVFSECPGQAGEGGLRSAIFRDFPAIALACPPRVLVGALCVPCAEVVLLEASGGSVEALRSSRNFPAIFPQFLRNFRAMFRNWIGRSLTANPPPLPRGEGGG